jgi:protein tyrosine/serine phosphatase
MPYTPKTDRSHSQGLLRSTDTSFLRNPEASRIPFPQIMLKQSSTARGKFLSTLRSTKSFAGLSESNLANLTHANLNHIKDLKTLTPKDQPKNSKKSLEQTKHSVLKNLDLSNTNFESFNGFADESFVNQKNFEDP